MHGAADDAAAKRALSQGPVLVRTGVVDGVIAAVHVEKGRLPVHTDGLAVQGGDIPASAASQAALSKAYACFLCIILYFSD